MMKNTVLYILPILLFSCGVRHVNAIAEIAPFGNYSTVEWERVDAMYYRPYAADWSEEIGRRIHPDFPQEVAAEYWHSLQNAKTDFHRHSLPLRATSSTVVSDALDRTEAMFDTVFVQCVEQEYYMRLFVDMYNEIMSKSIDDLCLIMAKDYKM